MPTYTYLSVDMLTGQINGELRLRQVSATTSITGNGAFSAYMPLGDPAIRLDDPGCSKSAPWNTCLLVDRDGVIVWAGIVWARSYDSQQGQMQITGNELLTWFNRQYIDAPGKTYTAQDQLLMAADLANYAQSKPNANVGIIVPTPTPSGIVRTAAFNAWDRVSVGQILTQYAAMDQGYDIRVSVAYEGTPGEPVRRLLLGYPRLGVRAADSQLLFEYPGSITRYVYKEDGVNGANVWHGDGAGSQQKMLLYDAVGIPPGSPRIESVVSDNMITDPNALAALTTSMLKMYGGGAIIPQVHVDPAKEPVLGSYQVGDEARFVITDNRFPQVVETYDGNVTVVGYQHDQYHRIVSVEVRPADTDPSGSTPEVAILTLNPILGY